MNHVVWDVVRHQQERGELAVIPNEGFAQIFEVSGGVVSGEEESPTNIAVLHELMRTIRQVDSR